MAFLLAALAIGLCAPRAAYADFTMTYVGKNFVVPTYCTPSAIVVCPPGPVSVRLNFTGDFPANYTGRWFWQPSYAATNRFDSSPPAPSVHFSSGTISVAGYPAVPITYMLLRFENGVVSGIWGQRGTQRPGGCSSISYGAESSGDFMNSFTCNSDGSTTYYKGRNKTPGVWTIEIAPPQPRIIMSGHDITSTTQSAVVGQQIVLGTNLSPSTIQSQAWEPTGDPISYTISSSCKPEGTPSTCKASYRPLDAALKRSYITTFYWVKPGNYMVSYNVTYTSGEVGTASASFVVAGVTANITHKLPSGGVKVYNYINRGPDDKFTTGWYLSCGVLRAATCIEFDIENAVAPMGFDGEFGFIQLARHYSGAYTTRSGRSVTCGPYSAYNLDNSLPYPFTDTEEPRHHTFDRPFIKINRGFDKVRATFRAQMYVAWKARMPKAIWIPVKYVEWFWSGTANRNAEQWSLDTSTVFRSAKAYNNAEMLSWPESVVNGLSECILGD